MHALLFFLHRDRSAGCSLPPSGNFSFHFLEFSNGLMVPFGNKGGVGVRQSIVSGFSLSIRTTFVCTPSAPSLVVSTGLKTVGFFFLDVHALLFFLHRDRSVGCSPPPSGNFSFHFLKFSDGVMVPFGNKAGVGVCQSSVSGFSLSARTIFVYTPSDSFEREDLSIFGMSLGRCFGSGKCCIVVSASAPISFLSQS